MRGFIIAIGLALILSACSASSTSGLSEFPLAKGTTWVYAYETYEPGANDSNQTVKATYQITETVTDIAANSKYYIAHVQRQIVLFNADQGWTGTFFNVADEFWYVVDQRRVYQSEQPVDIANITFDKMGNIFDFPLELKKTWCSGNPASGCEGMGERQVTNVGSYASLSENFDDCYELIDSYNSGGVIQWFCKGVGVVSISYDHLGTPLGFSQKLIRFEKGQK